MRDRLLKKNGELVDAAQRLTDCELMKYFRNIHILGKYTFKDSIPHQSTGMEFASKYSDVMVGGGFRDEFLLYMRNLCRIWESEMGVKKWASRKHMVIIGKHGGPRE